MTIDTTSVPGLTTARYEATKGIARKIILNKLVEPPWANDKARTLRDLPDRIVYAAIVLLLIVTGASPVLVRSSRAARTGRLRAAVAIYAGIHVGSKQSGCH